VGWQLFNFKDSQAGVGGGESAIESLFLGFLIGLFVVFFIRFIRDSAREREEDLSIMERWPRTKWMVPIREKGT
jgi:hypothetical protein